MFSASQQTKPDAWCLTSASLIPEEATCNLLPPPRCEVLTESVSNSQTPKLGEAC